MHQIQLLFFFLYLNVNVHCSDIRFSPFAYTFSVLENEPAGTQVGQVHAVKTDGTGTHDLIYGINPSQSIDKVLERFEIDEINGRIVTKMALDREEQDEYFFTVIATDRDGRKSEPAGVKIIILGKYNISSLTVNAN